MVESQIFKEEIRKIVSQDYKLEFLGDDFDKIASFVSESRAKSIYSWIQRVLIKEIQPITIGSKRQYKDWKINDLMTFRYPFQIGNTEYRILFVKVKNQVYIEFHLGDHNYYDKIRKDLGIKKN